MKCTYPECQNEGESLLYPDGKTVAYFCSDHMGPAGFCLGCGSFWGGVESFHFGDPRYLCDDCRSDPELVFQDEEWEEDRGYDG